MAVCRASVPAIYLSAVVSFCSVCKALKRVKETLSVTDMPFYDPRINAREMMEQDYSYWIPRVFSPRPLVYITTTQNMQTAARLSNVAERRPNVQCARALKSAKWSTPSSSICRVAEQGHT